jgi:hypothetical protein
MASVVSSKELFQTSTYEIGKTRVLTRQWVCVLSDDALATVPITQPQIGAALGIEIGSVHPVYVDNRIRKITVTEGYEGSPYHVLAVAEYGIILLDELVHPASRSAVWDFDSSPGEVPALSYYDGNTLRPLTNSAYDYFPGLTAQESTVVAKVTKNFTNFPSSWYAAQNCVNNATYLGCPVHSVKVQKLTVGATYEEFGGGVVGYWKATAELHYRQSGHNLQLPDIGWNFIGGGQKRRAMVFDVENSEWIASPNPVGLDGSGGLTLGVPAVLNRRVNPEANFAAIFGTPPTTVPAV